MNLIELSRKLISIDSTSCNGTKPIAEFLAEFCRGQGLSVSLHYDALNGIEQCNFVARPPGVGEEGKELVLQGHLDTADPGNYGAWEQTAQNPFNASIYNNHIYGLGAADVKLDLVAKILAAVQVVREHPAHRWKLPFAVAATFGEDSGMVGALKLIRKRQVRPAMILVGEPTAHRLVTQGAGLVVLECIFPFTDEERNLRLQHDLTESSTTQSKVFIGRAAHGSNPSLGENAIVKMFRYLAQLPSGLLVMDMEGGASQSSVPATAVLEFDMVGNLTSAVTTKIQFMLAALQKVEDDFANYPSAAFVTRYPTLNIGVVRTYEDHIKITGSCRLLPSVKQEVYDGWMSILNSAALQCGAMFRVTEYKPSFRTEEQSVFTQNCQNVLEQFQLNTDLASTLICTEASVFSRMNMECIVFGPGQSSGNAHSANEHLGIEKLEMSIKIYKKMIERLCL